MKWQNLRYDELSKDDKVTADEIQRYLDALVALWNMTLEGHFQVNSITYTGVPIMFATVKVGFPLTGGKDGVEFTLDPREFDNPIYKRHAFTTVVGRWADFIYYTQVENR